MAQYKDIDTILRQLDEFYITSIVQQKHDDMPEDYKKHWKGVQSGINYARNTIIEAPTADVVPKSEWISVEDRLPDELFMAVLIYCPDNDNIYCAYLNARNEWHIFDQGSGLWVLERVTHWMPLPEPPTE